MIRILDEIERLLSAILDPTNEKKASSNSGSKIGPLDISSNISVKVGLDDLDPARQPQAPDTEPLIDMIEKGGELKIVVYLPGIRKEDATVSVAGGRLVVEIKRRLQVYRKDFPCSIGPEIVVKQATLSNSVLEIACKGKGEEE